MMKSQRISQWLPSSLFLAAFVALPGLAHAQAYSSGAQTGVQQSAPPSPPSSASSPETERDISLTELTSCRDTINLLSEAHRTSTDTYNILARMVGDMVSQYVIQDINQNPLNGVHSFLFSRALHYCQEHPEKTLDDGIRQAKSDLDAIVQQSVMAAK